MVSTGRLRRSHLLAVGAALSSLTVSACGGDSSETGDNPDGGAVLPPAENFARDLRTTALTVDISTMTARARIGFEPDESLAASFEIGDLEITSVRDSQGPLEFEDTGATLNIGVPSMTDEIEVEYSYTERRGNGGVLDNGLTLTWPYFCGNIFPCKSNPGDGLELSLTLEGVATTDTAVYAETTVADAPSYMLAWAVGDYQYSSLGVTSAGTEVGTYANASEEDAMNAGTANLLGAFDWLEMTLGEYIFGGKVASVSADWGRSAFGGMEHHPLWHVGTAALRDEETHAHEAAHGWFGNGVRIACWEDFVLSEGTVSYLAARALEDVAGTAVSDPIWEGYRRRLDGGIAWPTGCDEIDILNDGLFSAAPYVKGALFFRSLETRIGRAAIDDALSTFYQEHRGTARRMMELLAHIETRSGYDAMPCALAWLRSVDVPDNEQCQ